MAQEKELSNQELRHLLTQTVGLLVDVANIVSDLATMGTRHESPNVRHVSDAREVVKKLNILLAAVAVTPAAPPAN